MTTTTRPPLALWLLAVSLAAAGVLLLVGPADQPDEPQASPSTAVPAVPAVPAAAPPDPIGPRHTNSRPGAAAPEVEPSPRDTQSPYTEHEHHHTHEAEHEPWRDVVTGFAAAFTAATDDHGEWIEQMRPWVTPYLASQYEATDPRRRPSGDPTSIHPLADGEYSADVIISYDTGLKLRVRAEIGPPGWQVTSAIPAS